MAHKWVYKPDAHGTAFRKKARRSSGKNYLIGTKKRTVEDYTGFLHFFEK